MEKRIDKYAIVVNDQDKEKYSKAGNTMLLLIDFQDKLAPQIDEFDQITDRAVILKKAFDLVGLKSAASEQYAKGLGRSDKRILDVLKDDFVIDKTDFSCYTKEFKDFIDKNNITDIVVTGTETHVCVYQSIRDFLKAGLNVFIVDDAVSSYSKELKESALKTIKDMGAIVVSSELLMFDLIKGKDNDKFKEVSSLVKDIRKIK